MKLTNIRLYNSGQFVYANLALDADSIQIAGRNNRGKTSLLWTLLFLFVVDRKQTTHPDYGTKESLYFYFPGETSYIVFEGFDERQGYFYLLLRRDQLSVKYHFAHKQFREEFLLKNKKILPFERVLENPACGLGPSFSTVSEVISRVVSSRKGETAFLRTKGVGPRSFSSLYKFLFLSHKNDPDLLKNGMLVSQGLQDEILDFGAAIPSSEREKWEREKREIKQMKSAREHFKILLEYRQKMLEDEADVRRVFTPFFKIDFDGSIPGFRTTLLQIEESVAAKRKEVEEIGERIAKLRSEGGEIQREIGKKQYNIDSLSGKLETARSYGEEGWLKQELLNAESERDRISVLLRDISEMPEVGVVEKRIRRLESETRNIRRRIEKEERVVASVFSDEPGKAALAHAVLSEAVLALPRKNVISPPGSFAEGAFLFNGAEISTEGLEIPRVPSREELLSELSAKEKELGRMKNTLEASRKKEALENERQEWSRNVKATEEKLKEVGSIERYEQKIAEAKREVEALERREIETERTIDTLSEMEKKAVGEIGELSKRKSEMEEFKKQIEIFYEKVKEARRRLEDETPASETLSFDTLLDRVRSAREEAGDTLSRFSLSQDRYRDQEEVIERIMEGSGFVPEEGKSFIESLEEQLYGLETREEELRSSMRSMGSLLGNRIQNFLVQMQAIETLVRKTKRILGDYRISDLQGVEISLVKRERMISTLESFDLSGEDLFIGGVETNDRDRLLFEYIKKEKKISLSDLFDIEVSRIKNGKRVKSRQSNGTERMLHVMLLLVLMREMIVHEDTIPFLIDEVMDYDAANQSEMLAFFREMNLLPISAAPHVAPSFEKVYHIATTKEGKSFLSPETATLKRNMEVSDAQ